MRRTIILISMMAMVVFLALGQAALADDDYFYIRSTDSPYEVEAGENLTVRFELVNKGIDEENVTAYVDPCPLRWECEDKTFYYEKKGEHEENITIIVSEKALPKRYTLYLKLRSEDDVKRGDDRLFITVVENKQENALSLEEYSEKLEEEEEPVGVYVPAEVSGGEMIEERKATEEEMDIPEDETEEEEESVIEEAEPEEPEEEKDKSIKEVKEEVSENIERLESDKGFKEYATVVLIILLIVTGIGALMAWRKKRK